MLWRISNESWWKADLLFWQELEDQKSSIITYLISFILLLDLFPISVLAGKDIPSREGCENLWAAWQPVWNLVCVARQNENSKVYLAFITPAATGTHNFFLWSYVSQETEDLILWCHTSKVFPRYYTMKSLCFFKGSFADWSKYDSTE